MNRPIWLLPVIAALAIHLPTLWCDFVYDDVPLIVEHARLGGPAFARELWQRDYGLEFANRPVGFYRPAFMTLVHGLRQLAGPSPLAFHLLSLALFALTTALVTRVTARLTPDAPRLAVLTGIFYAVHPARVEVVAMVMSMPDLLVELAGLALLMLLTAPPTAASSPRPAAAAALALALLAALTKESAFFIFTALALTASIAARSTPPDMRRRTAAIAIGALAGLALAWLPRHLAHIVSPAPLAATLRHLVTHQSGIALETLGLALREIIVPAPVVFWRQVTAPATTFATAGLVLVLAATGTIWGLTLRCGRQAPPLLAAWIGANMITLILLAAGNIPYAQRYLTVAPWIIAAGLSAHHLARRWAPRLPAALRATAAVALALYLATHAAFAVAGALTCLTPLRFFAALHAANPHAVVPLGALAQTLNKSGAPEPVEAHVRAATALNAAHPEVTRLHNMLIKRYLNDARFADALRCAEWSLSSFPNDADKLALKAAALASLGRHADALAAIDAALTAAPDNPGIAALHRQIAGSQPTPPIATHQGDAP